MISKKLKAIGLVLLTIIFALLVAICDSKPDAVENFTNNSAIGYFIIVTSFLSLVILSIIFIRDEKSAFSDKLESDVESMMLGYMEEDGHFKKRLSFIKEKNYKKFYDDLSKRIHTWLAATLVLILSVVSLYSSVYKHDKLYNQNHAEAYNLLIKNINGALAPMTIH